MLECVCFERRPQGQLNRVTSWKHIQIIALPGPGWTQAERPPGETHDTIQAQGDESPTQGMAVETKIREPVETRTLGTTRTWGLANCQG